MGLACRISARRRCRGHAEVQEGARLGLSGADLPHLVVPLDEEAAAEPELAGRKAANLATAKRLGFPVLPGFVITTAACSAISEARTDAPTEGGLPDLVTDSLRQAWSELSDQGRNALVVRSSSPGEDGGKSSMAGQFTSVLGVRSWPEFVAAVTEVIHSARVVVLGGASDGATAPMAVLVQPQLFPAWGGVLFGVDPVTGSTKRLMVAAVRGGPDQLVSGTVDGLRHTLTRRGRLLGTEGDGPERLGRHHRRGLARLAARAGEVFNGHQDIEWAYDEGGKLYLLQSRPVTAVGVAAAAQGPVLGPGPVAETFPDPLAALEADLWLPPLRQALGEAVRLTGAASRRRLGASPVIASVGGRVAADLALLGVDTGDRRSLWSRLDPRPPARRLRAAWRTGRLRAALPGLARDVVRRADEELASVPPPAGLGDEQLLSLLEGSRQALLALHGYEILAGMLSTGGEGASTSAAAALTAVADARAQGLDDETIVARHPVALALVAPAIGARASLPPVVGSIPVADQAGPEDLSTLREQLRLRARWIQELTARVAAELGGRLARRDLLPDGNAVRWLTLDELHHAVEGGQVPDDLDSRAQAPVAAPLPAAFRLTTEGAPVTVRRATRDDGQGAGGGRAQGRVHQGDGDVEAGDILVVRTLDPGLAAVLPKLGGLVAETGSVLSHLAILARELGVPTVVGVPDALSRFEAGSELILDGTTGEVSSVSVGSAAAA